MNQLRQLILEELRRRNFAEKSSAHTCTVLRTSAGTFGARPISLARRTPACWSLANASSSASKRPETIVEPIIRTVVWGAMPKSNTWHGPLNPD